MISFREFLYEKNSIEVFGEMHFVKGEPAKIINEVILRRPI